MADPAVTPFADGCPNEVAVASGGPKASAWLFGNSDLPFLGRGSVHGTAAALANRLAGKWQPPRLRWFVLDTSAYATYTWSVT
jgi:hypothetical protein